MLESLLCFDWSYMYDRVRVFAWNSANNSGAFRSNHGIHWSSDSGIPPVDEVLYLPPTSEASGIKDTFHFVFFFALYEVRKGALEVAPMKLCLLIWRKEVHMKHRVDVPLFRKMEL